ncbi:DUF3811 domain-containing protein, partial [Cronobacter dublinensis]
EQAAKHTRRQKKAQAYKPDSDATFSWSASTPVRGRR